MLDQEERLKGIAISGLFPVRKHFISNGVGDLLVFKVKNFADLISIRSMSY